RTSPSSSNDASKLKASLEQGPRTVATANRPFRGGRAVVAGGRRDWTSRVGAALTLKGPYEHEHQERTRIQGRRFGRLPGPRRGLGGGRRNPGSRWPVARGLRDHLRPWENFAERPHQEGEDRGPA